MLTISVQYILCKNLGGKLLYWHEKIHCPKQTKTKIYLPIRVCNKISFTHKQKSWMHTDTMNICPGSYDFLRDSTLYGTGWQQNILTLQAPGCQSESVCPYPGQLDLESRRRNILELSWLVVVAVTPGLRGSDGSHAVSTGSRRSILRRLSRILTLAGSWLPSFPSFLPIFLSLLSLCCYELCKVLLISPLSM